ncbi:S-adenosyl-L-methionine dependent methyltransferase, similar to cyclopropane-fatty-acyl-phospholipid synthase [Alloactinosynnema sp. L-07]|uniref:SAM-dependent methyltransferase n=1 Tax=Alloactinosynnema sp. L-07 TaxID=1653480 RepID=UPI00065EF7D0|nr:cyclopropane-fatty-acyl-phospholipid synthase family protein [Alloactinosynnema sp. L-07]CRK57690.1 S-adenosyl-L-methionine dependent methyltransferase, similar to cyclopropane-fatty-acyl-phospholipid synthase [Alloactinosynnema sp. L-07]
MTRLAVASAWPSLTLPAPRPSREWLVERVFRALVAPLPILVAFPGGERIGRGGHGAPVMRLHRPDFLFRRLGVIGPVAFGEAYMAGDWSSTDVAGVLTSFAARLNRPASRIGAAVRRAVDQARPITEQNTVDGARSNISRHYDLSDKFFALFLDETMTYSSALFAPGDDLRAAQLRKIDAVLDDAGVRAGTRVLEIGSGWGSLALRAARRGALVTTTTISDRQHQAVERSVAEAGLGDRVQVLLQDYRDADGQYDAVVSVEMIEAVGAEYWTAYFDTLDRVLVPGGRIALQAITMPHDRMLATKDVRTWIGKYIFPGGQIPSTQVIEDQIAARPTLRVGAKRRLGDHYARTLHEWRTRFDAAEREVAELGFDDTFRKMWRFYLGYSEAGFRSGYLDAWQLRVDK